MFFTILIASINYTSLSNTNFEGVIKYVNVETSDTLIYYIRSDKIRIHRKGKFVAKYGNYTDEFLDLENNRSALYNAEKGEYEFFDNSETYFPPEKIKDKQIILSQSCQGYEIDYGKIGHGGRMQDKIYVADDLHFKPPKNCTIQTPMITNGTGKIALKQIRFVESRDYFGESIFEAVEIIPMEIPDSLLIF